MAAEEAAYRQSQRAAEQTEADDTFDLLLANDSNTVLSALETAFEDNESPAAAIDCASDSATVVIMFGSPASVPDRKPAITPAGKPTLHKRSGAERNQLYTAALGSTVLATVKEGLAVAPGLNEIRILVVRKDRDASTPQEYLAAIYAGRFRRERMDLVDWQRVDPTQELLIAPDALMHRRGSAGEIVALDLTNESELATVVDTLRASI